MIKIVGLFVGLLSSSFVQAQSCQTIDLSAPGKVLHPLTASHQNGLGICHVEQLQRMLKAKMKGNPELGRVSLAMAEKKVRDRNVDNKKAVRWTDKNGSVGGFYFDAGNSCEAYERLKGQQICEVQYDQIENLTKLNANDQHKLLSAISIFLDKGSKSLFMFNQQSKVLADLEKDYSFRAQLCPLRAGVEEKFLALYNSHVAPTHRLKSVPAFNARDYLGKNIKGYLIRKYTQLFKLQNISAELKKAQIELENAYKNQERCIEAQFTSITNPFCPIYTFQFTEVFNLKSLGLTYKDFYRILDVGGKDRDQYFEHVFQCSRKKKTIPTNLSCTTHDLHALYRKADSDTVYEEQFKKLISANLLSNTPVGISVCTRFFKRPDLKTYSKDKKYTCGAKSDPSYQKGEGSHAVTIIGQRCVNGKTEYLVHNSWGKSCSYYDKSLECNKNGGFWVSSKVLSMNSRNLNVLK